MQPGSSLDSGQRRALVGHEVHTDRTATLPRAGAVSFGSGSAPFLPGMMPLLATRNPRGRGTLTGRDILNESPNRSGCPPRRLVIEATYLL